MHIGIRSTNWYLKYQLVVEIPIDPPKFRRHTPNWLRNIDSQTIWNKKIHGKYPELFFQNFNFNLI
jgi:hypothetical protein